VKRLLVLLTVLAASLSVTATASPASGSTCIPDKKIGVEVVKGVAVIVYCGHAKTTLKSDGTTTHYTKGACYRTLGNLSVAMGKYTALSHPKALFNAFLLVIPARKDGTYRRAVLTVQRKGKIATVANNVTVVVKSKLTRGTFKGKFEKGAKFSGSFTCK